MVPHPIPFPPVIDSSMMSAYLSCPTSWKYRYLEGWTRSGTSIHLQFGKCFAAAMDKFRQSYYDNAMTIDDALQVAAATLLEKWGDYDPSGNGTNKSLERCVGALEAFTAQYNPELDWIKPARDARGKLMTEFSFAIPLPIKNPSTGEPILYSGRFDQICESSTGILYGEDDKTTTQLGESWSKQWRLRGQFSGYSWGAREYGYNLQGFVVRGISILKRGYGHAEVIEQRPDWMLKHWYLHMLNTIQRMIDDWGCDDFPQSLDSACSSYGGCQFLDLCAAENPTQWLSNYENVPFDPLHVED